MANQMTIDQAIVEIRKPGKVYVYTTIGGVDAERAFVAASKSDLINTLQYIERKRPGRTIRVSRHEDGSNLYIS